MNARFLLLFALLTVALFLISQLLVFPGADSDARSRKRLQRRLAEIRLDGRPVNAGPGAPLREPGSRLRRRLDPLPGMRALNRLVVQAGYRRLPAHTVLLLSMALALGGALAGRWTLGSTAWAVAAGSAGLLLPWLWLMRARRRRLERFEHQLPEAVDIMKRALQAGHPINACLKRVAEEMPAPIGEEFTLAHFELSYGADLRQALLQMLHRVPNARLMDIAMAVIIQKETGGNLVEIFARSAELIRARFRFWRRLRSLSAEGRLSAWILALVPVVLFALLWHVAPHYLPPLLDRPEGRHMLLAAAVLLVVGVLWMRRMIRIEV